MTQPDRRWTPQRKIRVLIVDDSAVVRQILARELERDPMITVVGAAPDPYVARDLIVQLEPDVLTLDIEMPRMDGISFLRKLMEHRPMPVIVISSLTAAGTQTALEALAAGAVDVVGKPGSSTSVAGLADRIRFAVHAAAQARVRRRTARPETVLHAAPASGRVVFALGASTGGVQALTEVLTALPAGCPGAVVAQHMPVTFTGSFARRLASMCKVEVLEAKGGERVVPGRVLIAPGGRHMELRRSAVGGYTVALHDGPEVHHQRPSVDVLFRSVAEAAGPNAVGALLTGMGMDGAEGLLAMRRAGARTIAQDEATCVVFGMPAQAIRLGAAERVLPLGKIAEAMLSLAQERQAAA